MRKYVLLAVVVCLASNAIGQTVPAGGWTEDVTLGSATPGSSVSPEKGTYEVTGNGNDIWDSADAGQYLYKELVGDGSMTARVVDNGTGSNAWAKGGVMIRQNTETASQHAFMCITGSEGGGSAYQRRVTAGGSSTSNHNLANGPYAPPYWVRIERVGNDFTGFLSEDGENWTQAGDVMTIDMQDPVCIGLAVTSHAAGALRTYVFDNISFTGEVSGESDPGAASNPSPADEAVDVPRDAMLGWTAGDYPGTHDVYMGTNLGDANDATRADPQGVLLSQGQTDVAYDPGILAFGQTYYWRVDEVNTVGGAIFKSDVWSFTVEPFAYMIEGIIATSNGVSEPDIGPEKTVDGSGLNEAGQHSTEASDMWLGLPAGDDPVSITYEFDQVYKLHEMAVWNYNVQFELMLGFGLKSVTVEYSENGEDWMLLGDVELNQATALSTYEANTNVAFGGVPVKFVKLTINSNHGFLPQYGLSEVQFMQIPAAAREPQPNDGAIDVSVTTMLDWRAGREAVSHEVNFGTDSEALASVGTIDAASFAPGTLDLDTEYFWQVNEVNDADAITTWPGAIWGFTTQAYLVVEDFESYDDEDNRIYEAWVDGYGVSSNGSTVGHLESPFAEQTIVNGGDQSMPLFYDNAGTSMSEAKITLAQNWTTSGVKSLAITFAGAAGNTGQLYVKINGTKVLYDGDAAAIAVGAWQAWNIDLSTVGNVSNVTSLIVGVEGAGASGVVYIDDIRLYPKAPEFIVPAEPDAANLVAQYALDGNANDSSGNGHNGTIVGDVTFTSDPVRGQVVSLPGGDDQYISIEGVGISGVMPRTIACWAKADNTAIPDWTLIFGFTGTDAGQGGNGSHFNIGSLGGPGGVGAHVWGWEETIFSDEEALEWHHYAMTYDGTTIAYYGDGIPMDTDLGKSNVQDLSTSSDRVHIGSRITQTSSFPGKVDDAVIYSVTLTDAEIAYLAGRRAPIHKAF